MKTQKRGKVYKLYLYKGMWDFNELNINNVFLFTIAIELQMISSIKLSMNRDKARFASMKISNSSSIDFSN